MIETPQWLALLAEKVGVSYESAKELQKSFSTLVSNRLTKDLDAVLPFVGRLSTVLRNEFIAMLPDGSKYIVPPRIVLVLSPYEGPFPGLPGEALIESSRLTDEAVRNFLQISGELLAEYIALGKTVYLSGIGSVAPPEGEGGCFAFTPASTLLEAINNPFSAYETVPLSEGKDYPHLSHVSFDSREAINEIKPLHPEGEREEPKLSSTDLISQTGKLQEASSEAKETPTLKDGEMDSPPVLPPLMPSDKPETSTKATSPKQPPALPSRHPSAAEPPPLPLIQPIEDAFEAPAAPLEETRSDGGEKEKRSSRGWLPILLIILVVASLAGVAFFFYSEATHSDAPKQRPEQRMEKAEKATTRVATPDTLAAKTEAVEKQDTVPLNPRYITVQLNERLVDIALREYGYKSFWVYIYEENRDAIANPDRVPAGTRLKLPDQKQYGIDKESSPSRKKADSLQLQYNRQKGRA